MEKIILENKDNVSADKIIEKINDLFKDSNIKIFEDDKIDNKVYKFIGCEKKWNDCISIKYKFGDRIYDTTIFGESTVYFYDEKMDIYETSECFDCNEYKISYLSVHKSKEMLSNNRFILTSLSNCPKDEIIKNLSNFIGKDTMMLKIGSNEIGDEFGSFTDFMRIVSVDKDESGLILKCAGLNNIITISYNSTIIFRENGFVVYPFKEPINLTNICMMNFTVC